MEISQGRGYVYAIEYHSVWCVKYRRKVLTGDIEKSLFEILNKIATVSENTESQIKQYIQNQKVK